MDTKVCTKCLVEKPIDEFFKEKRRGGWRPQCKKCTARDTREYRANNPEIRRAARRRYRSRHPDKISVYNKQYNARHPERVCKAKKQYRYSLSGWCVHTWCHLNRRTINGANPNWDDEINLRC